MPMVTPSLNLPTPSTSSSASMKPAGAPPLPALPAAPTPPSLPSPPSTTVTLSSQAAWQRDWKAFGPLLRETVFGGKPRAMDLALFFAMWFVPRKVRHGVRSVMTRQRGKEAATAAMSAPKQAQPEF